MHVRAASRTSFVLFTLVGMVVAGASARTIRLHLTFDAPSVQALADGSEVVAMPDCATLGGPGLPLLPAHRVILVIPPGEAVAAVRAVPSPEVPLDGVHRIANGVTPRPIDGAAVPPPTPPDARVYGSDAPYPGEDARLVAEQVAWGHRLAFLQVHPVVYRPLSGRLAWRARITLEVETAPIAGADPSRIVNLRRTDAVLSRLSKLVDNPQDLAAYAPASAARSRDSRLSPDHFPYVIVTTDDLAPGYEELARFESSRGLRAKIVRMSEITADYPGIDAAEQLRNFVIDAYQNWQTEYVMLGGDSDQVPVRNLYCDAGGTIDSFPGDCYFEGLDGNWDANGNGVWGEPDEYDLVGEIAVGRVTARDLTSLANWIHKDEMYTDHPVVSEVRKSLFLGEKMDDTPTYSGCYMDRVKDYSCDFGYCTSGYPNGYLKQTLYDSPTYTWTPAELISLFNSGFPTSHHLGHANTTYSMKLSSSDVASFTNDGVNHSYMFVYTQGCDSNNFDNASTESISEVFLLDEHACAAFLGNTRYGWYCPGWCTGPSQHYERQLVDARYDDGLLTAGWMNVDSKVDNIWQIDPWNLWCHYELCLLGDPAMPQWDHVTDSLALHLSGTYVMGQGDYPITVTAGGAPASGALVTIYSDDLSSCVTGTTDTQGVVHLNPDPQDPATLHVKAILDGYLPGTGDVPVDPGAQPWLQWDATLLDDDNVPPSVGDGDGMADLGETAQAIVRLRNIGHVTATNVTAVLSCSNPHVAVLDSTAAYAAIDGMSNGVNQDDLVLQVSDSIQDGEVAHCSVRMSCDGRRSWTDHFDLVLHAPILALRSVAIDDSLYGNGDRKMGPNERFRIVVTLSNSGSDAGRGLHATLGGGSDHLSMLVGESGCDVVPAGQSAALAPSFEAYLDPTVPTEGFVPFTLHVQTWCGQPYDTGFDVRVQSYYEDTAEQDAGWTLGAPDDDATAGNWVRVTPVGTWRLGRWVKPNEDHTPEGTACFVTGQGGPGSAYGYDVDNGKTTLTSPVIDLTRAIDPHLVYWRWYTNSQGSFPHEDYWKVDISDNGGLTWHALENTNEDAAVWTRMDFRLRDHIQQTSHVKIRFIASDYGHESLIEAAVDDISIESQPNTSGAPVAEAAPVPFGIRWLRPNPAILGAAAGRAGSGVAIGYGLPAPADVTLAVFDVRGVLVRTLVEGKQAAGEHQIEWDGRGRTGRALPAGIYLCRLRAAGHDQVRKLVLLSPRRD